jgi:hypothetical protein
MIGHARSGHWRRVLDGEFDSPPSPPISRVGTAVVVSEELWPFRPHFRRIHSRPDFRRIPALKPVRSTDEGSRSRPSYHRGTQRGRHSTLGVRTPRPGSRDRRAACLAAPSSAASSGGRRESDGVESEPRREARDRRATLGPTGRHRVGEALRRNAQRTRPGCRARHWRLDQAVGRARIIKRRALSIQRGLPARHLRLPARATATHLAARARCHDERRGHRSQGCEGSGRPRTRSALPAVARTQRAPARAGAR